MTARRNFKAWESRGEREERREEQVKEKDHGRSSDPKPVCADRLSAAARHQHREQTQTQEERTQPEGQGQTFIHFMHIYRDNHLRDYWLMKLSRNYV